MATIILVLAAIGVFYILRPKVKAEIEPPSLEAFWPWELRGKAPEVPAPEVKLPVYSPGHTFHHKDTGEKIEVLVAPEIVNGEYKIRWPSGDIGYIHESSFEEFFE